MDHAKLNLPFSEELFADITEQLIGHEFSNDNRSIAVGSKFKYITEIKNLGQYTDMGLHVFVVKHSSEKDARIGLSKELFSLMKDYSFSNALVATYSSDTNWRYSLLTSSMQISKSGKVVRSFSNPKRYSYLLGPKAKTMTPYKYLIKNGQVEDLDDLKKRFSLEVVNKEFYSAISSAYLSLIGKKGGSSQLTLPGYAQNDKTSQQFAVRLLGRIIFCWFLKQKTSPRGPLIPEDLLSSDVVDKYQDYYHEILEPLFFETLNTEIPTRIERYKEGSWASVPYLNGGLFSPDREGDYYEFNHHTNVSEHADTLKIVNSWFLDLFKTLETYNFTIDENTIIDQELSIDPEMLGRIFENLLAEEINEETKESARKSTGSFYTPRQIVEYMVDESILQFLKTKTKVDYNKLKALVSYDEDDDLEFPITDDDSNSIIEAIGNLKILDPACGSGAYPMGILQKVTFILQKIDPGASKWLEAKISNISDLAFKDRIRNDYRNKSLDYIRKSFIIKDSIYGVDIQPIAIEVAKLRCFLTLIIDEDINDDEPNRGIDILPNLDFKFVAANTLISPPTMPGDLNLDQEFERRLGSAIESYFQPYSIRAKLDAWRTIDELIEQKSDDEFKQALSMQTRYYKNDVINKARTQANSKKIAASLNRAELWKSYKNILRHKTVGFFDIKYFFPSASNGFDIVIGNPPYVQLQKNGGELADVYKDEGYSTFARTGDIYSLFFERGLQLSKPFTGVVCYITSNKWMRAGYGEKTREYILKHNPLKLIDFGGFKVFESATVDTSILLFQNSKNNQELVASHFKNDYHREQAIEDYFGSNSEMLTNLDGGTWFIGDVTEKTIKEKIENIGTPLKDWDIKINYGIKTGYNEAFIIDEATKVSLVQEDSKNAHVIKPILRGRDIKRYGINLSNLYLIFIPWHFPLTDSNDIIDFKQTEYEFSTQYPSLYKHLLLHKDKLAARNKSEVGKRYEWYALQRYASSYYEDFEKEKIIYPVISAKASFYLDKSGYFINDKAFMITGESVKYLIAFLNSSVSHKYMKMIGSPLGEEGVEYRKIYLDHYPIPRINLENRDKAERLVELVSEIERIMLTDTEADISKIDKEINDIVYELYGFTEEEVRSIESHGVNEDN